MAGKNLASGVSCAKVEQVSQAAENGPDAFCHSERSEESLFLFMVSNSREIPRFARNDKINNFFRSLFCVNQKLPWYFRTWRIEARIHV